jgi:hypothetical protein
MYKVKGTQYNGDSLRSVVLVESYRQRLERLSKYGAAQRRGDASTSFSRDSENTANLSNRHQVRFRGLFYAIRSLIPGGGYGVSRYGEVRFGKRSRVATFLASLNCARFGGQFALVYFRRRAEYKTIVHLEL